MTEPTSKHTEQAILKAAETTGLDAGTIAAALDPARFHEKLGEAADDAVAIRKILWLAPDRACRLAAVGRIEGLLMPLIEAARNPDELWECTHDAPEELESAIFEKERSFVADLADAINLCECFPTEAWQRASALALVAGFVQKAVATGDYGAICEAYDQIRNELPASGLERQLACELEKIQMRDLTAAESWESALALLDRLVPHDGVGMIRATVETAIRFAPDAGALKYIMEHGATKDHQDLNRKALLRVLDLVGD